MPGERSTSIEVEERISQIFKWNLYGYSKREILRFAADANWGVAERTVEYYITEAKKRLIEMNQDSQAEDLSRILSLHLANYRAADALGDRQEMRKILECIAKLKGLDQVNLNVKIERPLKELSDDDLVKKITEETE